MYYNAPNIYLVDAQAEEEFLQTIHSTGMDLMSIGDLTELTNPIISVV